MNRADLPIVGQIEAASYTSPWPIAAFEQELDNAQAQFDVLKHEKQILGYSGLWYFVDQAHIGTIVSHPKLRRCGVGELLLINMINAACRFPVDTVTLEVRPSNIPAQNLYLKYGFQAVGRRKRYYPDNGEDALIMTTPLLTAAAFQRHFQTIVNQLVNQLQTIKLDESA